MTEFELLVKDTFERLVPPGKGRIPDWSDVLARAGVSEAQASAGAAPAAPRRRRRAVALAGAAILILGLGASPIGTAVSGLSRDVFDGLSSWLRGEPGTSAPAAEQAGFAARNAASYATFPRDTKLRLLARAGAGGESFSLLGFRSGSSLCLRLVRSARPGARGENQCVTLRELRASPSPALVAAQAQFRLGDPALFVEGIFGFADDTVGTIELRKLSGGRQAVRVSSNVFLALQAQPGGTVQDHPRLDPFVQVHAIRAPGGRVAVPFVAQDMGDYGDAIPSGPSYLARGGATRTPGRARIERRFQGGTIGWVERRETRGQAWRPRRPLGTLLFSRAIQPDPDSPLRVGVFLTRVGPGSRIGRHGHTGLMLCASELRPLAPAETGASCIPPDQGSPLFRAGQPLMLSGMAPTQIAQWTGLAADEVARIDVHLAGGRVIPAALRDNAFAVSVPATQPGKIVVRDRQDRVIWILNLPQSLRPKPCPPAALRGRVSSPPTLRRYERIDLGAQTVNGSPVFGRSPAEIEGVIGRPDRIAHHSSSNGHRQPTYYYGGQGSNSAELIVQFGWRQQRIRAISLTHQGRALVDARLGNLLAIQPEKLQRHLRQVYGSAYRLDYEYGSIPGRGCVAGLRSRSSPVELTFGVHVHRPGRPFLTLTHGY